MICFFLACTQGAVDTGQSVLVIETADPGLPALQSFEVQGTVLDQDGSPLPQASVLMGGLPETRVESDDDGQFSLWYEEPAQGTPVIVAGKQGYRAIGVDYFEEGTPVSLTLTRSWHRTTWTIAIKPPATARTARTRAAATATPDLWPTS